MLMIPKNFNMAIPCTQGSSANSICRHSVAVAFSVCLRDIRALSSEYDEHSDQLHEQSNAEKSAFMMVQMWPADSQLSGGHCDVVRSMYAAFGAFLQQH